jgi:hypothetical protein
MRNPLLSCLVAVIVWTSTTQAESNDHPEPKTADLEPWGFQTLAPQIEIGRLLGAVTTVVPRPGDRRAISFQSPFIWTRAAPRAPWAGASSRRICCMGWAIP